ncbi:hypothetical protein BKA69DRAFT_1172273, partial [Paraphysoderma sedebokerense]
MNASMTALGDKLLSPPKRDRYPLFYLQLTCPADLYDVCLDPQKSILEFQDWKPITTFLSQSISNFLLAHGFITSLTSIESSFESLKRPPRLSFDTDDRSSSSPKSKASKRDTVIGARMDQGEGPRRPLLLDDIVKIKGSRATGGNIMGEAEFLSGDEMLGRLKKRPHPDSSEVEEVTLQYKGVEYRKWVDPATGKVYFIDVRTGNSFSTIPGVLSKGFECDGPVKHKSSQSRIDRSHLRRSEIKRLKNNVGEPCGVPHHEDVCKCNGHGVFTLWAQDALKKWANPIFSNPEPGIKSVPFVTNSVEASFFNTDKTIQLLNSKGNVLNRSLEKRDIERFEVLGQVDEKFIACLVKLPVEGAEEIEIDNVRVEMNEGNRKVKPANNKCKESIMIVLVDQHAADERIRLEELLDEFHGRISSDRSTGIKINSKSDVHSAGIDKNANLKSDQNAEDDPKIQSVDLVPSVKLSLSPRETETLERFEKTFNRWGIEFAVVSGDTSASKNSVYFNTSHLAPSSSSIPTSTSTSDSAVGQYQQKQRPISSSIKEANVTKVPMVIHDRVKNDGKLLTEIVKQHLYFLDELSSSGGGREVGRNICPRGILEVLHSKACRSAIMFGDRLTNAQCQRIIGRLAECSLPFQCAHGRPSMSPIFAIEGNEVVTNSSTIVRGRINEVKKHRLSQGKLWGL